MPSRRPPSSARPGASSRPSPETDLPSSQPSTPDNSAQSAQSKGAYREPGSGTGVRNAAAARAGQSDDKGSRQRDPEHPDAPAAPADDKVQDKDEETSSPSSRRASTR